jgi:NADH-quinone oxidoreductase subunit N
MVFLLSAAGIPPLAGFFGKFYVLMAGLKTGSPDLALVWLVVVALVMSAVSFYYYLQVLKRAFVYEPDGIAGNRNPARTVVVVIVLMALGTVVFGCVPTLLMPDMAGTAVSTH